MAQSGFTPIILFNSTTAGNTPTTGNLAVGELAINAADGKLYYNTGSAIKVLAGSGGAGVVAGSNTQVQYNNSGVFGASSSFTFDGTTLTAPSYTFNTATTGSTNKGPLNYGTLNFSDTGIVQSSQTSVNSYFQNVIQNTSNGTQASAEFIAYNDQGTATTNYATVGINSSGYSGTGSINAAGYGFFVTASTDLVLGTIGANGIHFTTNSSATDALAISSVGAVSLPGGTANGVAYLNGSKVLTTGSALTFDGTTLTSASNISAGSYSRVYNGTIDMRMELAPGLGYVGTVTNHPVAFEVNNSEQMRLNTTGLGIGTSSPAYKLDVSGNFHATSTASFDAGVNLTSSGSQLTTTYSGVTTSRFYTSTSGLNLSVDGSWPLIFSNSSTERARIDSSGRLLIGTTTQNGYLTVNSGASAGIYLTNSSGGSVLDDLKITRTGAGGSSVATNTWIQLGNLTDNNACGFQLYNGGTIFWGNQGSWVERMRIDGSGNLLVGTNSALSSPSGGKVQIAYTGGSAAGNGLLMRPSSDNGAAIAFLNAAVSQVGYIYTTSTATQYNTSSDYRLKNNIQPMMGALAKVAALKPVTYKWNADNSDGEGFIAHELAEVCPHAVTGAKDAVDAEGKPQYQGIDTSFLVATLTAAIQELKAEFDAYKASHP